MYIIELVTGYIFKKTMNIALIKSSNGSTKRLRQRYKHVLIQPKSQPRSLLLIMMKLAQVGPRRRSPLSGR
jgi:hypothetical protein